MLSVPDFNSPKPHQEKYIKDAIEKFKTNFAIFSTAPTGSGKTHAAGIISRELGKPLFVVAPSGLYGTWDKLRVKCNLENMIFISYDSLAGKSFVCKHDYLIKVDGGYLPTKELEEIIAKGYLFVFDEVDEAKNPDSQRLLACHAITKAIVKKDVGSRIMLLSATMIDKKKFSVSILKLLGIIIKDELVKEIALTRTYLWKGLGYEDVYKYCVAVDPESVRKIHPVRLTSKNINEVLYELLCTVVKPRLQIFMPRASIDAKFYPSIEYHTLPPDQLTDFKDSIKNFRAHVLAETSKSYVDFRGIIMYHLHVIETKLLPLICNLLYNKLTVFPNRKYIVYVWFDTSVDYLMRTFSNFNPLQCDGKSTFDVRENNIKLFQQHDLYRRLIIAKPTSFAKGINLDDTHGDYPREIICVPNYDFNRIHQAAGRTYRTTTKSDSYFSLIFIKDADILDILTVLSEKSDVSGGIISDRTGGTDGGDENTDVLYPKDYPRVYYC